MRITPVNPTSATGKARTLLDGVKAKLGVTPNMMTTMANAPAVLEGYLQFSGALGAGTLPAGVREQIALYVAELNACNYCLAAHSFIGKHAGLSTESIEQARSGRGGDAKQNAVLDLARKVTESRGAVSDADVQQARAAGVTDAEVLEIIANVALNVLTNYINKVSAPVVDFPAVRPAAKAA